MVNALKYQAKSLLEQNKYFMDYVYKSFAQTYSYINTDFDFIPFESALHQQLFADSLTYCWPIFYAINPLLINELTNQMVDKKTLSNFQGWDGLVAIQPMINSDFVSMTWSILTDNDVKTLLIDVSQKNYSNLENPSNLFNLFKIFEDARSYDFLLITNANYNLAKFFIDYGISEYISCTYIFLDEESSLIKNCPFTIQRNGYILSSDVFDNPLYEQENATGFALYNNLREWKKEIVAPTRDDPEYRKMKKRVRQRDNNTCQCCGYHSDKKTHHKLEVHHIFGYKDHLDYRIEDKNCVVLCQDCHKKYHSLYGRKDVAPDSFMKFIRDYNSYTNKSKQTTLI